MSITYSENEIDILLQERKVIKSGNFDLTKIKVRRGHIHKRISLLGDNGNEFQLILRRSSLSHLDFSVILAVCIPQSNQVFRLRRYNGSSHRHTNRIEKTKFKGFHIHYATERYQNLAAQEDGFAEQTDQYCNFNDAIQCALKDANILIDSDLQDKLF